MQTTAALNATPKARRVLATLSAGGRPAARGLVECLLEAPEARTLLAVCPNSEAVTRAALAAAQEADAPLLFAATLNQVDLDGGYTGWTPEAFVGFLDEQVTALGVDVPVLPGLDHGGPWMKDRHVLDGATYADAFAAVKRSIEACLEAGYLLLHIDPTADRTLPPGTTLPVSRVVDRTLELIVHAEAHRRRRGLPPVGYEVGTEEVHGGLVDLDRFDAFLDGLAGGLRAEGLSDAWPVFVVGQVGTDLHTHRFDPVTARRLTERVRPTGALVKGHYTDHVEHPEIYPLSGLGGANVGPELTAAEYEALMELVALERQFGARSGMDEALHEAVVESGRWRKWLQPEERDRPFDDLDADRRRWLVGTGCRYVWTEPAVVEARRRLYRNVRRARDADAFVLWRIRQAILKYFHAFHLVGFNARIGGKGEGRSPKFEG